MRKATSADGTTIAYDRWGSGPLVIVGGAFNDRGTWAELAQVLAADFTVVSYDRRGRGRAVTPNRMPWSERSRISPP